jgi:hypothetical protein
LKVLKNGQAEPARLTREQKAEAFREQILELYPYCKGNLVRVHEELVSGGASLSYPALTAFCRRHGIGQKPPRPVGHYDFGPAQEMQHDTSAHDAILLGKTLRVQTAVLVFCYSRVFFFQCYPTFNRFYCKLFLTDGLKYTGGACAECMVDNTSVVVGSGTGAEMIPAPEMEAFSDRFGFVFKAHEKGDANRSAFVERLMGFIENNFLAGREFSSLDYLNERAVEFCDKVNSSYKRHLGARPRELFAVEAHQLKPLPAYIPDVYQLHHRVVDIEGTVTVNRHRYSAPWKLIGKRVEVRETKDRIEIFDGPRLVGSHQKASGPSPARSILPEHRPPRGELAKFRKASSEEQELLGLGEPMTSYVQALKKRMPAGGSLALRRLVRLVREYPREALLRALETAAYYRLYDLERLERMILRTLAHDYFLLPLPDKDTDDE